MAFFIGQIIMADKKTFLLFTDLSVPFKSLSDEDAGKLIKAIFEYQNGGLMQKLPPQVNMAFLFIKQQLDRSDEHYEAICERNRINGAKGGRPSKPKEPSGLFGNPEEPKQTLPNPSLNPNPKSDKDKKHKYGEYSHVLLTDEQHQKIQEKTGDVKMWIKQLDEGIEVHKYKYNNHYLVILKWFGKDDKAAPPKLKSTLIPLDKITKEEQAETERLSTKLVNKYRR